jgi:multidrug efflux pump subunit AcrB
MIGRFFFEFGITVTVTVMASTFTALTLTPMLCSRLVRVPKQRGQLFRASERGFQWLERRYAGLLRLALQRRWTTVGIGASAFGVGLLIAMSLPTEFAPTADRAELMIAFETPEGATLRDTDGYARQIEQVLADTPEVAHQFLVVGLSRGGGPGRVNEGFSWVHLTPRGERDLHQIEVMQELRARLAQIPDGRAYVMAQSGGGTGQAVVPIEFVLQHTELDELARMQEELIAWMEAEPEYIGVNTDLRMNKPQIEISIQRDKASQMGVSVAEISNTLRLLLGEPDISKIERGSERYDVITEVLGKGKMVPSALREIYVRSRTGELVSLANLIRFEETIGPSEIHHFNRMRAATISGSTRPGVPLGEALDKLVAHVRTEFSHEISYEMTGEAERMRESFYYLSITIVFSILFIYLVLAAQFESLIHPFTILMALPLATIGAFGALWIFGMPFSVFAFIGLIMLLGLVTKNAILLIDYANVLVTRGRGVHEAAEESARTRFRPVLMTAVSTVLGMLPIALGFGAGGEVRAALGVSVAAGLLGATALTLIVIPVVYTLIDDARRALGRQLRRAIRAQRAGA